MIAVGNGVLVWVGGNQMIVGVMVAVAVGMEVGVTVIDTGVCGIEQEDKTLTMKASSNSFFTEIIFKVLCMIEIHPQHNDNNPINTILL
jgi:hypothetical protein